MKISTPLLVAAAAATTLALAPAAHAADTYCPPEPVVLFADGTATYSNEAGGGGCVVARTFPGGGARLEQVILAPGWTYVVKDDGGTTNRSRVQVQFTETATRRRVDVRMEAGRTVIK
jgi:hypothetical protein